MNCWQYLSLEPTSDLRAIKKAYALQLKLINQETDTEAFIQLRDALQEAKLAAEYQDNLGDPQRYAEDQMILRSNNTDLQQQPIVPFDLNDEITSKYQHLVLQVEQKNIQFQLREALFELKQMIEQLNDAAQQHMQLERIQRLLDTQDLEDFFFLLAPHAIPDTLQNLTSHRCTQLGCDVNATTHCFNQTLDELSQALWNQKIDDDVYHQFQLLLTQRDQFNISEQITIKDQLLAPLAEIDAEIANPQFQRFLALWESCYPEDQQNYSEDYYPQRLQSKLIEYHLYQSIWSTSLDVDPKHLESFIDPQDFSPVKMFELQQQLSHSADQTAFEQHNPLSAQHSSPDSNDLFLTDLHFWKSLLWVSMILLVSSYFLYKNFEFLN
ncbi:hypothetical protein [Acinetobacter pullicarnis]|uniref:hypothetical protein n=1 Tax=Acinetobacter pullicarnis TaxID=2576829 RepID=UPI001121618E|nr:hypothetical protein [Acinetobacter pullicarnis]